MVRLDKNRSGAGGQHSVNWRAPEYFSKKKTGVWYAGIGLFFFAVMTLFFFLHSWLASLAVILVFWLFLKYAEATPPVVKYSVSERGITIGDRHLGYSEIHSFVVDFAHGTPLIVLETDYPLAVPRTILVPKNKLAAVLDLLLEHLPQRREFSFIRWLTHLLHY